MSERPGLDRMRARLRAKLDKKKTAAPANVPRGATYADEKSVVHKGAKSSVSQPSRGPLVASAVTNEKKMFGPTARTVTPGGTPPSHTKMALQRLLVEYPPIYDLKNASGDVKDRTRKGGDTGADETSRYVATSLGTEHICSVQVMADVPEYEAIVRECRRPVSLPPTASTTLLALVARVRTLDAELPYANEGDTHELPALATVKQHLSPQQIALYNESRNHFSARYLRFSSRLRTR